MSEMELQSMDNNADEKTESEQTNLEQDLDQILSDALGVGR